ncbi:MAG: PorV/PorQ family protein [Endomicrobiales bacterium]|nr:PorV/PorQ family protein [Endomicrobiales bacterium]
MRTVPLYSSSTFRIVITFVFTIYYSLFTVYCLFGEVQIHPKAGTTSATFLKYGIGSRAVAMGSAFGALADDASALYWNPAGLARLEQKELSVTHNESFENIKHDFAGYAFPVFKGYAAIAAYGLYTPEDIERRSGLNEADPYEPLTSIEGYFKAYDTAAHLSYARFINKNLSLGGSLKYIQQTIDTESASGVAVDAGALYSFDTSPLSLGLAFQHVGTEIKFREKGYPLPMNVKLAAAYRITDRLTTTFDLNQPVDNYLFISSGWEYFPVELLSIRAGYRYRLNGLELGDLHGLSAGLGFNFKAGETNVRLDYAFVPYSVLGDSHRMSLSILFSDKKKVSARLPEKADEKLPEPETTAIPAPPALPAEPEKKALPPAPEDFTFYSLKTSVTRRQASATRSLYSVAGKSSESTVAYLQGSVRANPSDQVFEIGEQTGQGKVYRNIVIRTSFPYPLMKCAVKVRIPKDLGEFSVKTFEGNEIKHKKMDEYDEKHDYFIFYLDIFGPFSIEVK